ncbi:MAG: thioesterase [Myxococcales bacterium]|nr:thioesterase [Myxococcales bacterium]
MIDWRHWGDPATARIRLICLPYAGGSASIFHVWQRSLPADVSISAPMLPGRGRLATEPLLEEMAPLIEATDRTGRDLLRAPYVIYGHSMGALVAYAWLRRALDDGAPPPEQLFVAASRPPFMPSWMRPVRDQGDDELLRVMLWMQSGEAKPAPVDYLRRQLPLLRADLLACETLIPDHDRRPLPTPLVALGGRNDPLVKSADLQAWSALAGRGFVRHTLPGGHFFALNQPAPLLRLLDRALTPGAALWAEESA